MSHFTGIYTITCLGNNKIYVGSSKRVHARWSKHKKLLERNQHKNQHMQNAYNKYGLRFFQFKIIEECSEENLCERENYYIDKFKSWDRLNGFNKHRYAYSPRGHKLSVETRKKISNSLKGRKVSMETRRKIGMGNKGKVMSKESIEKIRKSKMGKKQSEESILKRAKEYSFIKDGKIYSGKNIKRFADKYGLHRYDISRVLSGERKSHHGFKLYKGGN